MLSSSREKLQEEREYLERNIIFFPHEHLFIHKNLKKKSKGKDNWELKKKSCSQIRTFP